MGLYALVDPSLSLLETKGQAALLVAHQLSL